MEIFDPIVVVPGLVFFPWDPAQQVKHHFLLKVSIESFMFFTHFRSAAASGLDVVPFYFILRPKRMFLYTPQTKFLGVHKNRPVRSSLSICLVSASPPKRINPLDETLHS